MDEINPSEKVGLRIETKWNITDSTGLTRKIYKTVEKNKIKAEIEAKPGSLELYIAIVALAYPIAKDIISYVKRKRTEREELAKAKITVIHGNNNEIIVL